MKLVIVTAVVAFQKDVLKLFKNSGIEAFSTSEIDGYKTNSSIIAAQRWFPTEKGGSDSIMFFSFTQDEKIEPLFELIKLYNLSLKTDNPVRAAVIAIEHFI